MLHLSLKDLEKNNCMKKTFDMTLLMWHETILAKNPNNMQVNSLQNYTIQWKDKCGTSQECAVLTPNLFHVNSNVTHSWRMHGSLSAHTTTFLYCVNQKLTETVSGNRWGIASECILTVNRIIRSKSTLGIMTRHTYGIVISSKDKSLPVIKPQWDQ